MAVTRKFFSQAAELILEGGYRRVEQIFSKDEVAMATLRSRQRRKGRNLHTELVVSLGRPNYRQRATIKRARRVGLRFPRPIQTWQ